MNRIRNERIRGIAKVGDTSKKVQERSLNWYGHVLGIEEEHVGKRVMVIECRGREGEEVRSASGWITSGTACRRENCTGMKHNAGLSGSVS